MFNHLLIRNYLLIENINIDLKKGFTAITGETGSGKSLILHSICLLIGKKVTDSDFLCKDKKIYIEGSFDCLSENTKSLLKTEEIEDDEIIVSREIISTKKSIYRINGIIIKASFYQNLLKQLIDINLQHEELNLLDNSNYYHYIDNSSVTLFLNDYNNSLTKLKNINENYKALKEKEVNRQEVYANLLEEYQELKDLALENNEYNLSKDELKKYDRFKDEFSLYSNVLDLINQDNLLEKIKIVNKAILKINEFKEDSLLNEQLDNAFYTYEDLNNKINAYCNDSYYDENRIDYLNERLNIIERMMKKYHCSFDELIDLQEELSKQINEYESLDFDLNQLFINLNEQFNITLQQSIKISNQRNILAKELEKKLISNLKDLELKNIKLRIIVEQNLPKDVNEINRFTKNGIDKIDILVSFNKGIEEKSISTVVSGGEMSRFSLAIKNVLYEMNSKDLMCVIFDEVDTGLSGKQAESVGKKLLELSKNIQVLSITHSPNVASLSNEHLRVFKLENNNSSNVNIEYLNYEGKINEITKMLGNNDFARSLAVNLILKEENKND